MDSYLIDYLKSGQAWVLVGSGPSVAMGYPSWKELCKAATDTLRIEQPSAYNRLITLAFEQEDYPMVFERVKEILGGARLLEILNAKFNPSNAQTDNIYELITSWPVPVYLTTNYDDEVHDHLSRLGEAYRQYLNSEDHFGFISPDLKGAIIKLHGDLRSETGLILTSSQYKDIQQSDNWEYWRTKMTSVFQMNRVIVVGHSLTDKNIQHVLASAKKGSGVHRPVCWIAPDVKPALIKEYLEKYRIRVIPYDNKDGNHRNLVKLIEDVSAFLPQRTAITIKDSIANISSSPLGENSAAPGFFVFNKFISLDDFDKKRIDILIAAIQSALPELSKRKQFSLLTALEVAGWPNKTPLDITVAQKVRERAISDRLLESINDEFKVVEEAIDSVAEKRKQFEHTRDRFKLSLYLRLRRDFTTLTEQEAHEISNDIEGSLSGFFREGGLSLASTLVSTTQNATKDPLPSSIIKFISEASARYNDILKRQAFCSVAIDAFAHSGTAEREYLGRISQGFFGFHLLGVFGQAAVERLRLAKETVWLIDSSALIPALALASSSNDVFLSCFLRLRKSGIRLFTTERLFDEIDGHLIFAQKVVEQHGANSYSVIAAAQGQAPYRQSNVFLEGFIRWQASGQPCDWERYCVRIFETGTPDKQALRATLNRIGIEVIDIINWPGFTENDFATREEITKRVSDMRKDFHPELTEDELHRKAIPEAEALIIITKERSGEYFIISKQGHLSAAWFISSTSLLNTWSQNRITWQPEAFLRFCTALPDIIDPHAADRAFEALLWGLAQSGVNLLDEKTIKNVCGGIIDQSELNIKELRQLYKETIEKKYSEPIEAVLARVRPSDRPLAAIQIAKEIALTEKEQLRHAQLKAAEATKRAEAAEMELKKVDYFRKKMELKKGRIRKGQQNKKRK